jgi:uncharacterized protein
MSQPGVIDGLQFAHEAGTLEGVLGLAHLSRLAEMRCRTDGLSYKLSGRTDAEGRCWLEVAAKGTLTLECQRCLGPLEFPLALRSEVLLAMGEREIATADDDIDRVLAGREMDVGKLVEDEVLLALPMAPRHVACGGKPGDEVSGRSSPFAALGRLKGTN